uniref:Large ribosomal subunit protein uL23c n=1 Tax=Golenkinia longispicula TaxID=204992 RepID=A0A0S2ICW6_9CHLO|nr:ribosomal protein L23 [Golenkinia longispicula]
MTKFITKNQSIKNQNEITPQLSSWQTLMKGQFTPAKMMFNLVKYPILTEKSYRALFKHKQYTFDVDLRLTKPQIKKLFKNLFDVNVIAINTHRPPRKKVRVGMAQGYRPQYKRVILTLQEGQSINFNIIKNTN